MIQSITKNELPRSIWAYIMPKLQEESCEERSHKYWKVTDQQRCMILDKQTVAVQWQGCIDYQTI